jgi:hypothetical protein
MNKEEFEGMVEIIGGPEPRVPPLAVVTRDRIRELIQKFDEKSLLDVTRELNVLPLSQVDEERWYGVRPDGDLLSFRVQRPYEPIEEEDLWRRAAALSRAVAKYPELEPLVPPPPLNCQTCARCGGSGVISRGGNCICEGLGWMPSIFDEIDLKARKE